MRPNRLVILTLVIAALAAISMSLLARTAWADDGPKLRATATLVDPAGIKVGKAQLKEKKDGQVVVTVEAEGLTPGLHGIHVHTTGNCASVTGPFSGAGAHFNPDGGQHGAHAGDLGNIVADAGGYAQLEIVTRQFTLSAGTTSVLDADGGSLVIHAMADDGVTDPSGNSGARVICGVFVAG